MNENTINDLLEALKAEFLVTLPERLTEIESLILSLPDNSDIQDLLRTVHSLKGAAGTHGFHIFTKICHQMEDRMRELIESDTINSQLSVDSLLVYNDFQNQALELLNNNDDNFSLIDTKLNQLSRRSRSQQKKILIVEPSQLYASMISSIVTADDCQVKTVNDGLLALENLLMQDYDVVITAMELPMLNGDALISAIRLSQSKNKDIKAILITTKVTSLIDNADLFNHVLNRNDISDGSLFGFVNS